MDAIILDVSMAYKFHYRDFDLTNQRVHSIIDTIQQGFTAMGGKKPKPSPKPKKVTNKDNYKIEDDIPSIDIVMHELVHTGQGTVIVED